MNLREHDNQDDSKEHPGMYWNKNHAELYADKDFDKDHSEHLNASLWYALAAYGMTSAALYTQTGQHDAPLGWPLYTAIVMLGIGFALNWIKRRRFVNNGGTQ